MEILAKLNQIEQTIERDNTEHCTEISVIVPICERFDDLRKLYSMYSEELKKLQKTFEFIFVVDGNHPGAYKTLQDLKEQTNDAIKIIKLSKGYGETTALMAGLKHSNGGVIMTLASYIQVEPSEIGPALNELENGNDLIITRRYPRIDSFINRIQTGIFHWIVRRLTKLNFHDITCGLKVMKREVVENIALYGDLHRFIPILANNMGFKIKEINVKQRPEDANIRIYGLGTYWRRLLDLLNIFFLIKFTKKPFRFFGLIGSFMFLMGFILTSYLGILRLLGKIGLVDKPALLLGILLIVAGIQVLSLGFIGEIILFTHSKDIKEYQIEEIVE